MAQLFTEDEVRKLIAAAVAEAVAPLLGRIAQLEAEVARLKKNSGNSSKPPSSDIVKPPKPEASKHRGKRSIGGHRGTAIPTFDMLETCFSRSRYPLKIQSDSNLLKKLNHHCTGKMPVAPGDNS